MKFLLVLGTAGSLWLLAKKNHTAFRIALFWSAIYAWLLYISLTC